MKNLVFVYGTLRENSSNNALLESSKLIGSGRTKDKFVMYSRSIPFVSKSQQISTIFGEVYEVSSDTLASLDSLESYNPSSPNSSWYSRSLVEVELDSQTV
ncbi:MAG TPA: gamma-glutamylcyclotransferase, partial [Flavobacteriales bacterium]|nr:gamma-glutamylcyclotransferase [Flavobacteriales bacterium]